MKSYIYILFVITIIFASINIAFADKGVKRKVKSHAKLTITNVNISLKNLMSFNFSEKAGLSYKGSILSSETIGAGVFNTTMFTYQKGNTTYIIPYKHKVIIPDMAPGYTGLKFIIHSKK